MRHSVTCLLFCAWVCSSSQAQTVSTSSNLLGNGGFEKWVPVEQVKNSGEREKAKSLASADAIPEGWIFSNERNRDGENSGGEISLDENFFHGGIKSLRIRNKNPGDLTLFRYSPESFANGSPLELKPRHRYLIRWWVRGENVDRGLGGAGPIMMMTYSGKKDGKNYSASMYERDELPRGTFDWTRREFTFTTDEGASSLGMTFQLRWAKGTVWYDDIELIDKGEVPLVESF